MNTDAREIPQSQLSPLEKEIQRSGISCELRLASGETRRFGQEPPAVMVTLKSDKLLQTALSEYALGKASTENSTSRAICSRRWIFGTTSR